MRPDFKNFRGIGIQQLSHSAKGSTWKEHKYIKRLNGTYYYPDNYEGGRHLPDNEKDDVDVSSTSKEEPVETLSSTDIENLALEVIRGNFGNGQVRKDLLGEYYQQIQNRVNEIYEERASSIKVSEITDEQVKTLDKIVEKATTSAAPSLNFEQIFSVYRKKGVK